MTITTPGVTLAAMSASVPVMSGGNTPYAARYARELREVVVRWAHRQPRSVQRELGPSELGHICHRLVVGKMSGQQITNHVIDPWPSIVGTAVHALFAEFFEKENTINGVRRWIAENRVAANVLLGNPGTADLYDANEYVLVDHKILGPTTLAKVQSAGGPSWHYIVQMLIYAQGYRDLGYRVDRVILAAWPRTAPTLDSMYCWERPYVPAVDDDILRQTAALTAARRQVANYVLAGQLPIEAVPRQPGDECAFCLQGDTEVATRDGIKPIRELAGTKPELLVPRTGMNPGLEAQGDFVSAPVRSFGKQQLWEITLTSRGADKIVYATAEHRWLLTARASRAKDPGHPERPLTDRWPERVTSQLRPGDRLRPLRAFKPTRTHLMPPAVAQGFVFGDGTKGSGNRPASLTIYDNGKDEALLPFFPLTEPVPYDRTDPKTGQQSVARVLYGLPRFWKDTPPIRESRTFLVSWLAGYFAADGSVADGGQVTLCSASEQAILFARDVAAVCGIGYSPARHKERVGFGTEATRLWSIDLRRRDLPSWFFIIKEHAIRAAAANELEARGTYWTVKSVQATDQVEEVFCATVPGAGAFGLADDLLTGNCPWFRPQSARDGAPGCPGHSAKN
jgi:hypothetical protein